MLKRVLLVTSLLGICNYASAQVMVATVDYTDNEAKVTYGLAGLPYERDCDATLRTDGGVDITTVTSTEGSYKRIAVFSGLTATTTYRLYISCGLPYQVVNNDAFTTLPNQGTPSFTLKSVGGTHPTLTGNDRARVVWGSTSAMVNTPVQNTVCSTGCTIDVTPVTPGFWYREWQWQTTGDVVIGHSGTNVIMVGTARAKILTSSANGEEPDIPNLAKWELHMQIGTGDRHADEACTNYANQGVLFGTYYDGAQIMEQIGAYILSKGGDPAPYYTCAQTAHTTYLRNYVLPNNGSVPGYNEFATGMKLTYERLGAGGGDPDYRNGILFMSGFHHEGSIGQGAAYCSVDWDNQNPLWIREAAYCLRTLIEGERIGITAQVPKREALVDKVILFLSQWVSSPGGQPVHNNIENYDTGNPASTCYLKYFSDSLYYMLASSILITYVEEFGDPGNNYQQIFDQIKWTADWMWQYQKIPGYPIIEFDQCWESSSPADLLNPLVVPRDTPNRLSAQDLNLLAADMYSWLYTKTCDPSYRQKADDLFSWGVDKAFMDGDGKHFNQQYQYSFRYVARRLTDPCP